MSRLSLLTKLLLATLMGLSIGLVAASSSFGDETRLVVSKQLLVRSIEFGCFPYGFSPAETELSKVKFIPLANHIASRCGFSYGYRITLDTKLKTVRVSSSSMNNNENHKPGTGDITKIHNGYIYGTWPLDGVSNGHYWIKVWLNDVKLPVIRYEVRFN